MHSPCFSVSQRGKNISEKDTLNSLRWRHNERNGVSNHRRLDCFLNHLIRRWSKKTSKLRVTSLCGRNSSVTDDFPAQMASNAENISIRWCHQVKQRFCVFAPPLMTVVVSDLPRCSYFQNHVRNRWGTENKKVANLTALSSLVVP